MKKKKFTMMGIGLLCGILFGCTSHNISDFIPGTYVRTVINEFSVGRDTLVIIPVNNLSYTIIHKGSYRRIKEGALLPQKRVTENWLATYDKSSQVLIEGKKGKIISFNPSENILLVGSSPYKKIK